MQVWRVEQITEANALQRREIDVPVPAPDQYVIEVEAASVTFDDTLIVRGKYQVKPPPFTPGSDVVGLIVCGEADGQRLASSISDRGGSAACVLVPRSEAVPIAEDTPAGVAPTLRCNFPTSLDALRVGAKLRIEWRRMATLPTEKPCEGIQVRREGEHVAVVRLNRPYARNAVSSALAQALDSAAKEVEADASVRVAILTGMGSAFCAGADLKEMDAGGVRSPRTMPAGGFEIILTCDLAIASSAATFDLPEVKRGLSAAAGGIFRPPRRVPRDVALETIVTGDPIDAAGAEQLGLINRVVETERVLPEAIALTQRVGANAPLAVP